MDTSSPQSQNINQNSASISNLIKSALAEFDVTTTHLDQEWNNDSDDFKRHEFEGAKHADAIMASAKKFEQEKGSDIEKSVLELINVEAGEVSS